MNRLFILSSLLSMFFSLPACGIPFVESAGDSVADAAKAVGGAVVGVASDVDDSINDKPIGLRRSKCQEAGGLWVEKLDVTECIDGIVSLTIDGIVEEQTCEGGEGDSFEWTCAFQDANAKTYFADGPSIPPSILALSSTMGEEVDQTKYVDLFFESGVQHDYCYHHSPINDGVTQKVCDSRFFDDLASVCHASVEHHYSWFAIDICRSYAAMLYAALRAGGESSFKVMNTSVQAPTYVPIYQQLGLPEQPDDEDLRNKVDSLLEKLSLV